MDENDVILILKDLIKNPQGRTEIDNAVKIDAQTSFLTDRILPDGNSDYSKSFLNSVNDILKNEESMNKFRSNYKFPLEINGFCDQIYEKLKKIWDGQNKNVSIVPESVEHHVDYSFYKNKLFKYYFKLPNTLLLISKPSDGSINSNFIKSKNIISFDKDSSGEFNHVLFAEGDDRWFFSKSVIVNFTLHKENILITSIVKNVEESTNIFHVSAERYNMDSDFVRTNKLGSFLADITFLQSLYIYSKITDPYSFFLIIQKYAPNNCNYSDDEAQVNCSGGYLYMQNENGSASAVIDSNRSHKTCPKCNQSTAAGSVIKKAEVMVMNKGNDIVDEMLSFIAPPVDNLRYADEFIEKYEKRLDAKICGLNLKLNENLNHNSESVINSREGQETVLVNLKEAFEPIVSEIEKAKISYNQDVDHLFVNLGTYFLVADINSLYAELEKAQIDNPENVQKIKERIIETENSTDYPERKRSLILLRFYPDIKENMLEFSPIRTKTKQAMFNSFINYFDTKFIRIGYDGSKSISETLIMMETEFDAYLITQQ